MPTSTIGSHARAGTRSGLVAGCVLVAAAGDLLLLPLMSLRIASLTLLVLAGLGLYELRRAAGGVRAFGLMRSIRRDPAPWAFGLFAVALVTWAPLAYVRSPAHGDARAELTGLVTGVLLAAGTVAATRGTRDGLRAMRLGWVLGLGLAVVTAGFEVLTGRHVHADETLAWTLDPSIVAGPFRNPNDFAAALAVLVSGTLAYRAGVRQRLPRTGLSLLAALGVVAVILTQSRGGLVAIVLVLAIHAARALWDRRAAVGGSGTGSSALGARDIPGRQRASARRTVASRSPLHLGISRSGDPAGRIGPARAATVTWGILAVVIAAATVAAFTVPVLVRLNPLATMIAAAGQPGTARSDTLRLDLIRAGWRYFVESDRLGTGAGSFEHLLARDPNPGVSHIIWMHNSFLELLLQYGVVVAGALVAVVVAVLLSVVHAMRRDRPATLRSNDRDRGRGPETPLVIAEILCALVAFAALGGLAYTALETHAWWLMLAQAVAGAWWLTARPARPAPERLPDESASEVAT